MNKIIKNIFNSLALIYIFSFSCFCTDRVYKDWDFDTKVNCVATGGGPAPVTINIINLLDNDLEFKGYKLYSGKIRDDGQAPFRIGHTKNDRKGSFVVSGRESTLYGPEGTVAYEVVTTNDHIRIYWDCAVATGSQVHGKFYSSNPQITATIDEITGSGTFGMSTLTFTIE